ncbi:hypothetical protein ACIBI9_64450 [Nonomuraea sp. NPDC050451]|uniref:hypothetical protein n=1 Tax=Nonomuraea sp. NPDC050451 TaxID=3364364 RepID=UPI0037A35382
MLDAEDPANVNPDSPREQHLANIRRIYGPEKEASLPPFSGSAAGVVLMAVAVGLFGAWASLPPGDRCDGLVLRHWLPGACRRRTGLRC